MTQLNTASLLARSVPEALRSASGVDAGENAPATCMHTYIEASAARLVLVAMRAELVVKDCNTPLYVHACVAIISISQKGIGLTESQIAGGSTLGAEAKLVAREGGKRGKKRATRACALGALANTRAVRGTLRVCAACLAADISLPFLVILFSSSGTAVNARRWVGVVEWRRSGCGV